MNTKFCTFRSKFRAEVEIDQHVGTYILLNRNPQSKGWILRGTLQPSYFIKTTQSPRQSY